MTSDELTPEERRKKIRQKLKRLFGKHVDSIHKYRRNSKYNGIQYSATCDLHGVIIEWTVRKDKVRKEILDHLKGAHD